MHSRIEGASGRHRVAIGGLLAAVMSMIATIAISWAGSVPAHAAGGYWIDGKIQCVNSGAPVGVWVQANNGGSGWANSWVNVADGWGYIHFNKWIPNGGSWYLAVGCGGSPSAWRLTAYSNTRTSAGRILCNDIPPWAGPLQKRFPYLGWADFSQGVHYGRCA